MHDVELPFPGTDGSPRPAVDALALTANWVMGVGWTLRLSERRSGAEWLTGPDARYDGLSTAELLNVIDDELLRRLGDPDY